MLAYQGLIQWAVAFEHARRGNLPGAASLLAKALPKLTAADVGLDLAPCLAAAPALAERFAGGVHGPPPPAPPIRPSAAARAER